ncbi:hypothetical protein EK21DRAFT_85567 [Setomelanomma holmii]|uniref:Uncharacterized protein n=1 Tax=Setomelanomma holmii TaxID=210430 RepID=A0A9P4HJ10_9PLEO|nr:hypothetical protein EK21DRAFT_85567 [Setomelanomma holmii]
MTSTVQKQNMRRSETSASPNHQLCDAVASQFGSTVFNQAAAPSSEHGAHPSSSNLPQSGLLHPEIAAVANAQKDDSHRDFNNAMQPRADHRHDTVVDISSTSGVATQPQKKSKRPKLAPDQPRAGFLTQVPDYPFQMPAGPPLHFTLVDVIAITSNWFANSFFAARFLNNGLTSSVQVRILQEYRDIILSESDIDRAKDNISDRYRTTMRKVDKDWSRAKHKAPLGWDQGNMAVNMFEPDYQRERNRKDYQSIPFKALLRGLKKLPHGSDAGDLTRALHFAMQNTKTGLNGEQLELMFPDDIHMILGRIGYTQIMPDHTDRTIIKRYKQAVKTEVDASTKRHRELTEAGVKTPPPKRPRKKKINTPDPGITFSRQVPGQLPDVFLTGEYMSQGPIPQTPPMPQFPLQPYSLIYGTNHPVSPMSSLNNSPDCREPQAPQALDKLSPLSHRTGSMTPATQVPDHVRRFSPDVCASFAPQRQEDVAAASVEKDGGMASAHQVGDLAANTTLDNANAHTFAVKHRGKEAHYTKVSASSVPNLGQINAQDSQSSLGSTAVREYDTNLGGYTGAVAIIPGTMADMDAFLAPHQTVDYSHLLYPDANGDFPFLWEDENLVGIAVVNAWRSKYPDTRLLRDCAEADDPNDHSDLARAARWCRDPANKAEEYVIGYAWLALSFEEMLKEASKVWEEMHA